jgi:dGTP triphosphohydrolase
MEKNRKEKNMVETREMEIQRENAEYRLSELESVITKNFQGFYVVGCALAEIKAGKLYRKTHVTFANYCRDRFEIAQRTAYQYIVAKNTMDNVRHGAQTEILPLSERQVRPLTRLMADAQVEAWKKVVQSAPLDGRITAKHVSDIVSEIIGKEVKEKTKIIKDKIAPAVSGEFTDALWALIEVVRAEVAKPLKAKMRENMRDSIRRVENLLAD